MKKVYSIKERLIYIPMIALLSIVLLFSLINFRDKVAVVIIIFYICILFIVLFLLKLFSFPFHIVVNYNRVQIFDFPLWATNKFYDKKRSLILWNGEVFIDEVKSIELVKLTKDEKAKYIGYAHLFSRYIKVNLINSNRSKYIYVSPYSNLQIKKIINLLQISKA